MLKEKNRKPLLRVFQRREKKEKMTQFWENFLLLFSNFLRLSRENVSLFPPSLAEHMPHKIG